MGRATGKNNPNLGALELLKGLYQTLGGAARGATSATLGLPGDLETLARMLLPEKYARSALPTTEDVSDYLPKLSEKPNTMEELGRWMPATPMQAAKIAASAAKPAAKAAGAGIHEAMMGRGPLKGALASIAPMNVIKPKGGNWLPEGLPARANPMESLDPHMPGARGAKREDLLKMFGPNAADPRAAQGVDNALTMNKWIEGPLRKYIMRDMATEGDPIRKLADQGILHVDPQELNYNQSMYGKWLLDNQTLHAKSDMAKAWEGVTDNAISTNQRLYLAPEPGSSRLSREHPWVDKLPEDEYLYGLNESKNFPEDVGFDRLIQSTYDDLINGQLDANQLNSGSFSVEAAVRLAHQKRMAEAAKAEAEQLQRSRNAAVFTHKEYKTPENTDGFHWVQIRKPEAKQMLSPEEFEAANAHLPPAEWDKAMHQYRIDRAANEGNGQLQQALTHEGDVMGHCVGDYCDDVSSGATGIYSLRDAKGKSHVTIETRKGNSKDIEEDAYFRFLENHGVEDVDNPPRELVKLWKEQPKLAETTQSIMQIKGSGKKDPMQKITAEDLPKFQPYIKDFLNERQWSNIRDLTNTGMRDMSEYSGHQGPRFMTLSEHDELLKAHPELKSNLSKELDDPNFGDGWEPENIEFAEGGLVNFDDLDIFLRRRNEV